MSEFVKHPSGKTLYLAAKRKTTPTPANAPKPIYLDREIIEVQVFDSILANPAAVMGHAAIEVRGISYNRQLDGYHREPPWQYIREQASIRDIIGVRLWVTPMEADRLQQELERRVREGRRYNLLNNSCSTNTAQALELIGIMAHDPRGLPTPITPAELLAAVRKSSRVVGERKYPKGWKAGASENW